jgi:hypothetical protein
MCANNNMNRLFVSIVGIVAYNYYKLSKKQQAEKGQYQMIPLHSSSNRNLKDWFAQCHVTQMMFIYTKIEKIWR